MSACRCDATVPGAVEACPAATHECSFCGQAKVGAVKAWCAGCLATKARCDRYARDTTPHGSPEAPCPGCSVCLGVQS